MALMGIFDDKKGKQIEYLEEERVKLWNRLISLENTTKALKVEVQRKASDDEKDAAQSSKKAAEFKNRAEQRLEEATQLVAEISKQQNLSKSILSEVEGYKNSISQITDRLVGAETSYSESYVELSGKITSIDEFLLKYPDLETDLEEVDEKIAKIEENSEKSTVTLTALNKRKKEIDDLYRAIFGYTEVDEYGKTIKIEGLKDEITKAYDTLSGSLNEAQENIEVIDNSYKSKYEEFEKDHKEAYNSITSEIEALLPNALTAGLSAAFSIKKQEEVVSSDKLQKRFSTGIYLLIAVSLIPFVMSTVFLLQGIALEEAIRRIPRLVLAIIPMYIPVMWFTYSANKKSNLSKRLIEEYAHKEVLSKTYEGLSKQIASINDSGQSDELKFRLLSNFLQVSSENPGKLISNYEASDHPIMEALEQSYKFQIAIDRLEGIPGLGKVAAILESKSKRKLDNRKDIIESALAVGETSDSTVKGL